MKRGINLRGFEIELEDPWYDNTPPRVWQRPWIDNTVIGAGPVLVELMMKRSVWHDMNDMTLAKYFAARGKLTNLNAFQYGVWTALTYASREGHLDILKALIAAGANKDKTDGSGYTPLSRAASSGRVECVKALLAVKADVNKASTCGATPLIWGSRDGHVEILKLLLAAGAKKDKIDTYGDTALTLATKRGHHEIVQLLQQAK